MKRWQRIRRDYWEAAPAPTADEAAKTLWNAALTPLSYTAENERYRAAILEQYKLYVEMADRISARRALANTFFLTLNTAILTAIGVFWNRSPRGSDWALVVPLIVLLGQCLAWFWLVRSYRQLNAGKYAVVGALERELPASPYWAEWTVFGEGKDRGRYWPLTHLEQRVPVLFALAYLSGFVLLIV